MDRPLVDGGLGFAIFHLANHVDINILVLVALDVNSAAEGTGGVIVGTAEDLAPEEVLAFGAPEVGQHLVQRCLDLAAALLADGDINP